MAEKPHKRAGEADGRRLYPGERAAIWAKAAVTAWPIVLPLLGLLGYTNKDHIREWAGMAEADGKTEVEIDSPDRWQQVSKFSTEVTAELEAIRSNSAKIQQQLAARDNANYSKLASQLEGLNGRLAKIEKIVQP